MTLKSAAWFAAIILFCFACDNKSTHSAVAANKAAIEITDRSTDSVYFEVSDTTAPQPVPNNRDQGPVAQAVEWDKKIVKTASLNAEVKDYKAFARQLPEKVKKLGGYVSHEEQSQNDYQIQNSLTIKVPVDQFETAISELTRDVFKLGEKRISSEDVTAQVVDGKSRLEARKQVRLRYLQLLKQARNMEEVLTVQKEIDAIQESIELVSGRINVLSHQSAMSTIHFTFFQVIDASARGGADPGFPEKVKRAFASGWFWIGEAFIGLISIWPLLAVIIPGIWFFKRKQMPRINSKSNPS